MFKNNRHLTERNQMIGTKPLVVNIYWIMESVEAGDPVEEKKFLVADKNGSMCEFNRSCLSKSLVKEANSVADIGQESKLKLFPITYGP